jgi:hypothetical protein
MRKFATPELNRVAPAMKSVDSFQRKGAKAQRHGTEKFLQKETKETKTENLLHGFVPFACSRFIDVGR